MLAEQLPRTGKLENAEVFNRENHGLFRAYLERHRDEIRAVDLDLASFVCVTSIEAITHMAVLHNADTFPDEAMNALVDEAARLHRQLPAPSDFDSDETHVSFPDAALALNYVA